MEENNSENINIQDISGNNEEDINEIYGKAENEDLG